MAKLSLNNPARLVKTLLIGESGSGKTGALVSLIAAGYDLRILDMDCKIETGILPLAVAKVCPEKADNVQFESLRDVRVASSSGPRVSKADAFVKALALLDKWSDGTSPRDWGPNVVFVLDSFTFFSDAAFEWAKSLNPGVKDPRQWYSEAQRVVEHTLALVTSPAFNCNVVIISHISWVDRSDGTTKGYPSSVGKALGPMIPAYFDNLVMTKTSGSGQSVKRQLITAPDAMIDLKNPAASVAVYPIETGLKSFFDIVKGKQ